MENLIEILTQNICHLFGLSEASFGSVAKILTVSFGAVSLAFAGGIGWSNLSPELLTVAHRWHGSIDEQFTNIDSLVTLIQARQLSWGTPPQFDRIVENHAQLATLIPKCRSVNGTPLDRTHRNTLLKSTVGLCIQSVKIWTYAQHDANPAIFTADDVHAFGFLLPGEMGGHHSRTEATNVLPEVKVIILNADFIRVIIDQAATKQAAAVAHNWPKGVHQALLVITSVDSGKEIYHQYVTHQHSEIRMPEGSHGRQFIIKAAFLKHVDDNPKFGPQPVFSMPYTTEDLIRRLDNQQHEEYEMHLREIERHRLELERLRTAAEHAASVGLQSSGA
jgi:hypothetical protein